MRTLWNKRVLVTGASGFVGRHLERRLQTLGAKVIGVGRQSGGDILTGQLVTDDIDIVVHLAGRTFVVDAWADPVDFFRVNALGTVRILEQCRSRRVPFIYISAYVYGAPQHALISEEHPIDPNNPYAFSKHVAEEACRFYHRVFGVPMVIFRLFNVFGAGQNRHFLIPAVIDQALSCQTDEIVVADLEPKRDYVYIDDVVDAICHGPALLSGKAYNVGSGQPKSVREVIEAVLKCIDPKKPYRARGEVRPNEIPSVAADISALTRDCGWIPSTEFEDGIGRTVAADRI